MKVNLAAQVFSSSVADAIEFCEQNLQLPQFKGSSATVKFIRIFDPLFDVLNSRNPCAKEFKSALRVQNQHSWLTFMDSSLEYIKQLKDGNGKLMIEGRRKTGFLGFVIGVESVKGIFKNAVACDPPLIKYLLTYKFRQNHLELFFGAVCSAGGFNNNLTASQFTASYKRLLMRGSIQENYKGNGNCVSQEYTSLLQFLTLVK